ncbi:hypothetical protein ACU686_13450 [Yinghuangia aomiensis]
MTVPRGHVRNPGTGTRRTAARSVEVKLGVWISNTKTRRNKLTNHQLCAPREGLDWR